MQACFGRLAPSCSTVHAQATALIVALLPLQGAFHNAQMQQAGVELLSTPSPGSATGTVVVLTPPDADRTFMSYLGSSQPLQLTPEAEEAISSTRLLIIEGYLWEMKVCSVEWLPCASRSSCGMSGVVYGDSPGNCCRPSSLKPAASKEMHSFGQVLTFAVLSICRLLSAAS